MKTRFIVLTLVLAIALPLFGQADALDVAMEAAQAAIETGTVYTAQEGVNYWPRQSSAPYWETIDWSELQGSSINWNELPEEGNVPSTQINWSALIEDAIKVSSIEHCAQTCAALYARYGNTDEWYAGEQIAIYRMHFALYAYWHSLPYENEFNDSQLEEAVAASPHTLEQWTTIAELLLQNVKDGWEPPEGD